jgi:hypothetical protein
LSKYAAAYFIVGLAAHAVVSAKGAAGMEP